MAELEALILGGSLPTLSLAVLASFFIAIPANYQPSKGITYLLGVFATKVAKNDRPAAQQRVAGGLAILVILFPTLAVTWSLKEIALFPQFFDFLLLFLLLSWKSELLQFKGIYQAQLLTEKAVARQQLANLTLRETHSLSALGINKACIEAITLRLAGSWFGVFFWFVLGGIYAALVFRLLQLMNLSWNRKLKAYRHFGSIAYRSYNLLCLLPYGFLAFTLALYGNTGAALRAIFRQSSVWPRSSSGAILASLAASINIQLGGPRLYQGQKVDYPRLGNANSAEVKHLKLTLSRLTQAASLWFVIYLLLYSSMIIFKLEPNWL